MANLKGSLGDYIREQRRTAQISLRQLAEAAGVSNPYLSQIERGLRKPSADILQQIAKGLRISAEALYVQAGILEDDAIDTEVPAAIRADSAITERQKQVLLDIYQSFRGENAASQDESFVPQGESSTSRGANSPKAGRKTRGRGTPDSADVWQAVTDEPSASPGDSSGF